MNFKKIAPFLRFELRTLAFTRDIVILYIYWIRASWIKIPRVAEFLKYLFKVVEFLLIFESVHN